MMTALFVAGMLTQTTASEISAKDSTTPKKVIFDTDMSGDCDDVGALAVLNKLSDFGECEIIACVSNGHDKDKAIAATISAINTYYGRPNIPIGTYQGPGYDATSSKYTAGIRDQFPHTAKADDQEPRAVDVYRQALATAPNGSVSIVSVGFLINLRNLLDSGPDSASPLMGSDLVRLKVRQIVIMGGGTPASDVNQGEYNFSYCNAGTDTQYVVENWPTPMLFTSFQIGAEITTSKKLLSAPASNPVRRAYELFNGLTGRESWDLTAALAAVRPPELYWSLVSNGYCQVAANGTNTWSNTPRGHSYLVAKTPPGDISAILDDLLTIPPRLQK